MGLGICVGCVVIYLTFDVVENVMCMQCTCTCTCAYLYMNNVDVQLCCCYIYIVILCIHVHMCYIKCTVRYAHCIILPY